jgi:hypothetical protein
VPYDGPIPIDALRDLIALARALYATFVTMGPAYDDQRFKLRGIGSQLTLALQHAESGGPGTFKHRSAWLIAEKAIADLGEIVGAEMSARALIVASGERLLKRR